MARYKEFNPAVFSVVTFPFLFGVMFGDIGHGFIMALAGFLVVYYEKQLEWMGRDEMLGTVYKGRYNIFMMGIFATYAGFIYNELFAVPMELFASTVWCSGESEDASCLSIPGTDPSHQLQKWMRTNINEAYDFKAKASTGKEVTWNPYPIGSDPGWAHTGNKLNFVNSFKMKFAIIIGVIQMVCGVCTKLMNCLYFQDNITLIWVYIPEMVFINSIFGYLGILIMKKWTTNWDATYVLNHEAVVSIPQVYCQYDAKANKITNLPCWSAPFVPKPEASKMYGGLLDKTVGWCMKDNVLTAGCAGVPSPLLRLYSGSIKALLRLY
jgi:V-type H+-transporting ATPase subunit a